MKIIYLVRHSIPLKSNLLFFHDSVNNQEKNEKIPLSIDGEKLASEMSLKFFNGNIDYLWSSSYNRSILTARYISSLNNVDINISSSFNERKLGKADDIKDDFWIMQLKDENSKTINGESQKEVRDRMLNGITNVLNNALDDTKTVIVTHATAITFLLMNWCELKDVSLKDKRRWLTFNGIDVINDSFNTPEIFKLEFSDDVLMNITRLSCR